MKNVFNDIIIKNKFNSFIEFEDFLIKRLKNNHYSNKQVGDIFEEFNYYYFKIFSNKFNIKNCWSHKNIPLEIKEKLKLKNDQGADGVIETNDKKFFVYQTKFKSNRNSPNNNELKNTIAESKFSDGAYIFTNAYDVTDYIKKFKPFLILFEDLEKLDKFFFSQIENFLLDKKDKIKKSLTFLKNKAKTLEDIFNNGQYIIVDEVNFNQDDIKIFDDKAKKIISAFNAQFAIIDKLSKETLEPIVNELIKSNNTNFKGVGQPLRIALTGSKFGPGIYDIIISLGKEEVIKRLTNKKLS